jgi:hypothetical protein
MPKGVLTIGLNSVDPKHYGGRSGDLECLRGRRGRHGCHSNHEILSKPHK